MTTIYFNAALEGPAELVREPVAGSWISVTGPSETELDDLAEKFGLDRDLLADAVDIYEAPRVEKDGSKVYVYTRYCYPEGKEIATEPLLLIATADHLITVMRSDTDLLQRFTGGKTDVNTSQKAHLLVQIMEAVNLSYQRQIIKVSKQILRIRAQLRQSQISNRAFVGIIELEEDLNEFIAALQPQGILLAALSSTKYLKLSEDDREMIEDLRLGTNELIELTKSRLRTLTNIRQAYDAIATNNLNNTFKRLTSIAIFLTIPTIVGGLFGMNVPVPFADVEHAFTYVLFIITALVLATIWLFRRKRWL
ncbi:MAG TPA: magnesium transporter CorA family protein [Candidatus Saccharimonadales bacterium]|jgi:magnesium transporter